MERFQPKHRSRLPVRNGPACVGNRPGRYWNAKPWDLESDEIPIDSEASNSMVHDVGAFAKQCAGVFMATCQGIKIIRNHIHNTPRVGIYMR